MSPKATFSTHAGERSSANSGTATRSPSTRMSGGLPAVMWTSDARERAPWASNSSRLRCVMRSSFCVDKSERVHLQFVRALPGAIRGHCDVAQQSGPGSECIEERGDPIDVLRDDADREIDLLACRRGRR